MGAKTKFLLPEKRIPEAWYNIQADLPNPLPPVIHPGHGGADRPRGPRAALPDGADQAGGQPGALDRHPGRGTGRLPALAADAALPRATPRAGARHAGPPLLQVRGRARRRGSHKPNTAVAQAYYNKAEGVTSLATETGAGQWGSSLAMACSFFGLECDVYMVSDLLRAEAVPPEPDAGVRRDGDPEPVRQDERRAGRRSSRTPTRRARSGSRSPRRSRSRPTSGGRTKYSLGSVLNHVLMHQTVIGIEALEQLEMAGEYPGRRRRLRRRGLELRRLRAPVRAQQPRRRQGDARRRGRAGGGAEPDEGEVRLRLRRHGDDDAARQDAHARPLVHPGAGARGRPALPRDGADRLGAATTTT